MSSSSIVQYCSSHRASFASNVEEVANLLRSRVNCACHRRWDEKRQLGYGLRDEGLVRLTEAVKRLLDAPWVQLFTAAGHIMRQIIIN